jgi:translocation and assembly module TamB
LVVFDREEARAVTSGTLVLGSKGKRPVLQGDLVLNEALINLEKLPKSGPPTLDIKFREDVDATKSNGNAGFLGVDVTVKSERGIRITGRGVDAILGLDLAIEDELVSPTISGDTRIVRGVFELLGKRFEITPSALTFAEPLNDSKLNLEATRVADGYRYSVRVLGTVDRPEIELSSDPALPEDEVLSRVLFGRSPSQLSGLEAARLTGAVVQLNGGGGFDLLGGIEAQLGLDRLSIDPDAGGASALTTGKYLSDNVYVEVRTGVTGSPGVSIEWQALDNLDVEAETVPGEGQTLSVKWKKDFD